MKNSLYAIALTAVTICLVTPAADATPYDFNGNWVDVEAWTGTGSNETILVVDWNKLDNAEATVSESHAFGYRWDGDQYQSDMLDAFTDAGILAVTTNTYGSQAFLRNVGYEDIDDNETHLHIENGSWNMGSSADPTARWGTWGDTEWDFNGGGVNETLLADAQFVGANAILYPGPVPAYGDDQLTIPVPEPVSLSLLGLGAMAMLRRRKARA